MRSGLKLLTQALELARNLGDPNTLWTVGYLLLYLSNSTHSTLRRTYNSLKNLWELHALE